MESSPPCADPHRLDAARSMPLTLTEQMNPDIITNTVEEQITLPVRSCTSSAVARYQVERQTPSTLK